jgi:hypothetical protein
MLLVLQRALVCDSLEIPVARRNTHDRSLRKVVCLDCLMGRALKRETLIVRERW